MAFGGGSEVFGEGSEVFGEGSEVFEDGSGSTSVAMGGDGDVGEAIEVTSSDVAGAGEGLLGTGVETSTAALAEIVGVRVGKMVRMTMRFELVLGLPIKPQANTVRTRIKNPNKQERL